jgi:Arc/MetJ-type ribon-helix-helix transcriptional regulator
MDISMERKKMERIEIRISSGMKEVIGDVCFEEEVTVSEYVRYLIRADLAKRAQDQQKTLDLLRVKGFQLVRSV